MIYGILLNLQVELGLLVLETNKNVNMYGY